MSCVPGALCSHSRIRSGCRHAPDETKSKMRDFRKKTLLARRRLHRDDQALPVDLAFSFVNSWKVVVLNTRKLAARCVSEGCDISSVIASFTFELQQAKRLVNDVELYALVSLVGR